MVARSYASLLVDLHREIDADRGSGELAEALREELAALWQDMDPSERLRLDWLSEDMFVSGAHRVVLPLEADETEEMVDADMRVAFMGQDNARALGLLRKLPTSPRVAYGMGRCWERLGDIRASAHFYDFAYKTGGRSAYGFSALEALFRAGEHDEAFRRADAIERSMVSTPMLLLEAASILHRVAVSFPPAERTQLYERVIRTVGAAAIEEGQVQPSLRAQGLLAAAFSYEHLGNKEKALECVRRAVAVYPSEATFLARGLALLPTDRKKALDDFIRAADAGTALAWPYAYAAQRALTEENYEKVKRYCDAGLKVASGAARGRLLEWSAIAAANRGEDPDHVTKLFAEASAAAPDDEVIKRNRARWDAARQITSGWGFEVANDVTPPPLADLESYATRTLELDDQRRFHKDVGLLAA